MALGTIPGITAMSTVANAAVTNGSNISVFPNRDMVVAVGYEVGEQLLIEVVRNGTVIGTTQGPAVETPEGIGLEVNHGPLGTPQAGDCWTNFTPDIVGGDVIRVTAVERPEAPVDTMTVHDFDFTGDPVREADGSITVSGTTGPAAGFAVEFRRDKPDPRFRRGPFVPVVDAATGTWKATFRPTATSAEGLDAEAQRLIALNEASWLAVADDITETTLAELGEPGGVGPGCTGSSDPNSLVGGLAPINIASGDVTFSGTTRAGVVAVSVTVGGLGARDATVVEDPDGGPGTWDLTVPDADLASLPDGTVAVTPRFSTATTTVAGPTRNVLKDTTAPLAPTASIPAGTYSGTQAVAIIKPAGEGPSKVYWEIGNTALPVDEYGNPYNGQIAVTSSQTITAVVVDAAGNVGAVGTFAYKIGNPPPAPTNLSGSEVAPAGSARLTWSPVGGVSGYNVYRDGIKVNPSLLTGTSFTDTADLLGDRSYVVRAVEANGIESLDSNPVTVTVAAPDVPADLRATSGDTRVVLNWTTVAGAANYRIYRDGVVVATVSGASTTYTSSGLNNLTPYDFSIASVDTAGNESARSGVAQATPADTTPPPAPTFNVNNGTYNTAQTVTIADTETTAVIRYTIGDGTTVPADPTVNDTQYTGAITVGTSQVIKAAAFDAADNRSPITQRTYTIDSSAPTVSAQSPAADATGVAVGSNVTATFSEAVQGVSTATFALRPTSTPTATPVTATVGRNGSSNEWILNPGADLAFSTSYTATLTGGTGAIRDLTNNPAGTTSWSFTTAAAPVTQPPTGTRTETVVASADTWVQQALPTATGGTAGTLNVDSEFNTGNVNSRTSSYLRFTVPALAAGETITAANLSLNVTNNTPNGPAIWRTAPAWTEGTMTWNTGQPAQIGTAGNFGNMPVGRAIAPVSGITAAGDVSFQLFAEDVDGVQFSSKESTTAANRPQLVLTISTNGTVTPPPPGDTTRPTVSSSAPAASATNVTVGSNVTATFSEAVQAVSGTTFTLRASGSTADVAATVTYDATNRVATLNPGADLTAGTTYTATLTGGASAIRDTANNALATTTWSFTTAAPATGGDITVPTVSSRTPVASATGVTAGSNVTATFSETVQAVSGTTFSLRASGATADVAAAVTYDATNRVATLNPGADLTAGTTYTATLTGGASAIRDTANNALATTSWSFTTAPAPVAGGDTTAPTLSARTPGHASYSASATSNITATFSEPVQGVSGTTFSVRTEAGAAVAATVTYDATTRVATLDPAASLVNDTRYIVTVTGGATAIRDLANNPIVGPAWSFTVGPAPTLTARTPAAGATGVSRTANITGTFSENVTGVSATTATIRTAAGAVAATVTYNATTRVVTIDPSATLAAGTVHTVTLTGGGSAIRDLAGNRFSTTSWTFTTGA